MNFNYKSKLSLKEKINDWEYFKLITKNNLRLKMLSTIK